MSITIQKAKSLECRYCERRWPVDEAYLTCPACREPTEGSAYHQPSVGPNEAIVLARHYAFGWWLWDNDRL
jgi:hypothetical protein